MVLCLFRLLNQQPKELALSNIQDYPVSTKKHKLKNLIGGAIKHEVIAHSSNEIIEGLEEYGCMKVKICEKPKRQKLSINKRWREQASFCSFERGNYLFGDRVPSPLCITVWTRISRT